VVVSVATSFVVGLALRVVILEHRWHGAVGGDEAIVGLMAEDLRHHGDPTIFFWGQHYGGSLESMIAAALFVVLPTSTLVLKLVPMGLALAAAGVHARLASDRIGTAAGLTTFAVLATWPPTFVWFSTVALAFYWVSLLLGGVLVWLALDSVERANHSARWLALGFVGGAMWWTTPQSIFVGLPTVVWLLWRQRRRLGATWPAIPAFFIGSSLWWFDNLRSGWASLESPQVNDSTYLDRLALFFEKGVVRITGIDELVPGPELVAMLLSLVVVGFALVGLWRAHRKAPHLSSLLLAIAVSYPFLFAVFPTSWAIGEGRYLLPLWTVLAMGLAAWVPDRRPVIPVVLAICLGAVTLLGIDDIPTLENQAAPDVPRPADLTWAIDALDELGIDHVAGNYWVVYPMAFESDGSLVVRPTASSRNPEWDAEVAAAPIVAHVFVNGSTSLPDSLDAVEEQGLPHELLVGEELTLLLIDQKPDDGVELPDTRTVGVAG